MRRAIHAEWTKLRTVAAPRWLLLGGIALTVATGVVDPARFTVTGVVIGQAPIAVLAVLAMSDEYGSGMIRATLTATPRRTTALAAKAIVLTGLVAVTGTVALLASSLVARHALPDGSAFWSVLYLTLTALLGLGIATVVRDSSASIGVVLGLLYLVPLLSRAIADPYWQGLIQRIAPGLALHQPTAGDGLAVTAAWAATALLTGAITLNRRDA